MTHLDALVLLDSLFLLRRLSDHDTAVFEQRTELAFVSQFQKLVIRSKSLPVENELRELGSAEKPRDERQEDSVITTLVHVDDKRRWGNLVLGQHSLHLSVPGITHLAEKDDRVDGVDLVDEQVEIFPSAGSAGIEIKHFGRVERVTRVQIGQGIGSGRGYELESVAVPCLLAYIDERRQLLAGVSEFDGVCVGGRLDASFGHLSVERLTAEFSVALHFCLTTTEGFCLVEGEGFELALIFDGVGDPNKAVNSEAEDEEDERAETARHPRGCQGEALR